MKQSDWVFAIAVTIVPSIVGFVAGIVLAGDHSLGMSHGPVEYWLNRYQTLLVGFFALFGALVAWMQMKKSDRQYRVSIAIKHLPELNDLNHVLLDLKIVADPLIPEMIDMVTFKVLDGELIDRLRTYPASLRFVGRIQNVSDKVKEFNGAEPSTGSKENLYRALRKDVIAVHRKTYGRVSELCSILNIAPPTDLTLESK